LTVGGFMADPVLSIVIASEAIQRISMGVMFNKFVLRLITIAGHKDKGKDTTSVENAAHVSSSRSEVSFYSDR
jgi:hypothetical protein